MSIEYSVYGDAEKRLKNDFFNTTVSSPTNDLIFTKPDAVKLVLDSIEKNNPDAFNSVTRTYCDIASKSGAFLIGIAERIFNSPEAKRIFPNPYTRIRHIYQYQVFGLTSNMMCWWTIYQRVYKIYDRESKKEIIEPFCKLNLLNVERLYDVANFNEEEVLEMFRVQSNFSKEVKVNDWDEIEVTNASSDRKFDYIISNPPYQGNNHSQLYPSFYVKSIRVANDVCMIFPNGWQEPKDANNLKRMNNPEIKEDRQIVFIDNRHNVFPEAKGAEWTNIIYWKSGYDNKLNGSQRVLTNGECEEIKKLLIDKGDVEKPSEIVALKDLVSKRDDFVSIASVTSATKPYGLRTDFFNNPSKYGLPDCVSQDKKNNTDIRIYGLLDRKREIRFVPADYPIPRKTSAMSGFKVFVPYAWGNMSNAGLGGAYSDVIVASPNDICTEVALESGNFQCFDKAQKHAKYIFTKFVRALLFFDKNSIHTTIWSAVPQQDYTEEWWDESIDEIDEHLFEKYNVPENIREFVRNNIQPRTEENIVNF